MSEVTAIRCDGCGQIITQARDAMSIDRVILRGRPYWDGAETSRRVLTLDFCERCARRLLEALERIAVRGER